MNTDTPHLDRQPNEPDAAWHRRLKRHISKHAPKDQRYFVRYGIPGAKGQRWILPAVFVLIGLFFTVISYVTSLDVRTLNGPNGREGEFVVVESRSRNTKTTKNAYYVPVVVIRDTSVVPLLSKDQPFTVGEPVTLKYTQEGDVVAAFMEDDGKVSNTTAIIGIIIGLLFIATGLLGAKFYRGAVEARYVETELARLAKRPTTTK